VLGVGTDMRPTAAMVFVRSPVGEGIRDDIADEIGMIDLRGMDVYRQTFQCGPIKLDTGWLPRPLNLLAEGDVLGRPDREIPT